MNRLLKRINVVFFVALLVLALSASLFADASDVVKVRIGHLFAEGSAQALKFDWIANELEKRSDGRFECEVFPGGVVGGEKENVEDLLTGNLEITSAGSVFYRYVPEANISSLPLYNWATPEQATKIIHGYWDKLVEVSEKKGFFPLALDIRDAFGIWVRKPIQSLKEIEGMKFRSVDSLYFIELTKLFGAIPNPIPLGDAYMAFKTGVCDGTLGAAESYVSAGIHEVLKCYVDIRITLPRSYVLSSVKWINNLPDDLRNIVLEVCKDSESANAKFLKESEEKTKDKMIAAGVTFIEFDQIDKQELQELTKKGITFRDEFMKDQGPEVYEFYKEWMDFVEKEKAKEAAN